LEGYDIAAKGFGTAETIHLLAEILKIAFADRAAASGDPDFVGVPVERLTSKDYANERRRTIDPARAQKWSAGVAQLESAHTTHMTAADAMGNVVATTQTINNLFGAKILIPGLGTVPNNYMNLYDPRPGYALSLAPGKRVTTSMSPMMALREGKLVYALGLPGGKKIFPSALQALINLIDHGMSLQEAVEAPRVWTEGNALEVEQAVPDNVRSALTAMGHRVVAMPTVAGGMNAIQFHEDGRLTGAACWRADGTPIGLAGGLARAGVKFGLADADAAYFRTQITRTTAALASDDAPAALTPLAFKNSRTISAGTSTACAAGVEFGGPATTAGFNSAMPANLSSPSSAAPPEKPMAGAGDSARSLPPPTCVTDALTLLAATAPP
jgi:gamma-glutamyltranspeptidase/glutathione hydrolase